MALSTRLNNTRKNAFLSDSLLFHLASALPSVLLPGFEELGAFVASREAHDLSRLANIHKPALRYEDEWGNGVEQLELHPAYHALQRRSKQAGLASSLWERTNNENGARYQARAIRLFLMAGLETGHLHEAVNTSAAIAALMAEPEIFKMGQAGLLSRQHDFSLRPIAYKKGITLTFAFEDAVHDTAQPQKAALAQKLTHDNDSGHQIYRISAHKSQVVNPAADAYLITAEINGQLSCFYVPRLQENGQVNGSIHIRYLLKTAGDVSASKANLEFQDSHGWLIGEIGQGAKIIRDLETMLRLDQAIISAGVLRAALQYGVDYFRANARRNSFSSLTERVFADIALDVAAACSLVLRLAKAFDHAVIDRPEAAFARIMTPVIAAHVNNLVVPIVSEIISQTGEAAFTENNPLSRALISGPARTVKNNGGNLLIRDTILVADKAPGLFQQLLDKLSQDIGAAGPGTVDILKAAAQVALSDEGAGKLFVEQLAYAAAAASLRQTDMEHVSTAYIESRLGGQWRTSYGMLSARHNAGHILAALYPVV